MTRPTEARNPASHDLDLLGTEEILRVMNAEDRTVAEAVAAVVPTLARAVDATAARLRAGGRLFYIGAGTSGRLGVLDAVEIPPTFGTAPDLFQAVLAGGVDACHAAAEVSEDDPEQGAADLRARGCTPGDVVVGIAASGETLYTRGALAWARELGALTIALCCNPDAPLAALAEHALTPVVGPEVVTGSTRLKAGTAQKLVLNMLSTAVMVRLGRVYSNWMVGVQMNNAKLRARGLRILVEATGQGETDCRRAFEEAGFDLRVALVMLRARTDPEAARTALAAAGGGLRAALERAAGHRS